MTTHSGIGGLPFFALIHGGSVIDVTHAFGEADAWNLLTHDQADHYRAHGWTVERCAIVCPLPQGDPRRDEVETAAALALRVGIGIGAIALLLGTAIGWALWGAP